MLKAIHKLRKSKKGFTLIELLIVVAIIAILAAIAIPQFSQYRIRAYNGAAESDMRNIKVAAESFKTDWQVYASTKADGTMGTGVILFGPTTQYIPVAQNGIVSSSPGFPTTATTFSFGVSNGVGVAVDTDSTSAQAYTAFTKHTQGDRTFGADSDITNIKWKAGTVGTALAAGDLIGSTANVDNLGSTYPNNL